MNGTIDLLSQLQLLRPWWLAALLPALAVLMLVANAQSQRSGWTRFVDPQLLDDLLETTTVSRPRWRLPLLASGLLIAIVALAGPSWERLPQPPLQTNDSLVIILDLTLSMHATDVAPSRLIRTRYKILELLKQRREGETALIAYSADAHVVSPLTDDAQTIAALVPSLTPEIMPGIGSNAGAAFDRASTMLTGQSRGQRRVLWFTDELLPTDRLNIINTVSERNAELIIIGIGTANGGPIPLPSGKFLKDQRGQIVSASLNRQDLAQLADDVGGRYFDLQADNRDIDFVLRRTLKERLSTAASSPANTLQSSFDQWHDRGPWLAVLLLPFALLVFRRGWLLPVVLLITLAPGQPTLAEHSTEHHPDIGDSASFWQKLWQTPDQRGETLYRENQLDTAARTFENPDWRATADYRAGRFSEAAKRFDPSQEGVRKDSSALSQAHRHYNHGHALARSGDLQQAIDAYDRALALQPAMENARSARELVSQLLKRQQEQEQEQEQSSQPSSANQEDKDQKSGNETESGDNAEQQPSDQSDADRSENSAKNSAETHSDQNNQQDNQQAAQQNGQAGNPDNEKSLGEEESAQREASDALAGNDVADEPLANDGAGTLADQNLDPEELARLQQWLKQIPDDPGGLLRRKFQYQRAVREREGKVIEQTKEGQIW